MRLQHVAVTFPPGREGAIRAFYGEVLGLPETPVPAEVADRGWIWFLTDDDGVELHFIPVAVPPDPERMHHFCLETGDLADVRGRLEAAGVEWTVPLGVIASRERIFARDPVGNLVEFVEVLGPPAG